MRVALDHECMHCHAPCPTRWFACCTSECTRSTSRSALLTADFCSRSLARRRSNLTLYFASSWLLERNFFERSSCQGRGRQRVTCNGLTTAPCWRSTRGYKVLTLTSSSAVSAISTLFRFPCAQPHTTVRCTRTHALAHRSLPPTTSASRSSVVKTLATEPAACCYCCASGCLAVAAVVVRQLQLPGACGGDVPSASCAQCCELP